MLWRDEVVADTQAEQMVAAVLKASGRFKNADGSEITIPDPRQARRDFDARLNQPLDIEAQRAAALKVVGSA